MMKYIFILMLFLSFGSRAQFEELFDIPDSFTIFTIKDLKFNSDGHGFIISYQGNGGSPLFASMVYTTVDFGQTWDSTLFQNEDVLKGHGAVTDNGNMYFVSLKNVYPTGQAGYQLKIINSSMDNGYTWSSSTIDSTFGASLSLDNSLHFLNDSTGVFYYSEGIFKTTDFGSTWTKISDWAPHNSLPMGDQFAHFGYDTLLIDDLSGDPFVGSQYKFYSYGRQDHSKLENNTVYRVMNNSQGTSQGSNYNWNYVSIQVDPLPFGNQKVIHFPQSGYSKDLAVRGNCIFLQADGLLHRSCDQGDSFYTLNSFPNSPTAGIVFLEFINDTVGFAITYDQNGDDWKLWKTINGGGQDSVQVLTNTFYAGVDEIDKNISFEMYPNPSEDNLNIESEVLISEIEIYSVDGKLVLTKKLNSKNYTIDISSLSKGNYIVKVYSEGSVGVSKLVKN